LNDDYKRLKDSYSSLLEERESMKEENQELRQEITNQKADSESHMPNNLDLPYNAF
jgi:regulator of replication initiation timing